MNYPPVPKNLLVMEAEARQSPRNGPDIHWHQNLPLSDTEQSASQTTKNFLLFPLPDWLWTGPALLIEIYIATHLKSVTLSGLQFKNYKRSKSQDTKSI